MIRKSDKYDRRVLSFPAVHPCERISPATLLSSLIVLSRSICSYRTKFLATRRRCAREAIREVEILLMFFEEIRDRSSTLPESVALSFSELHVVFQKIQFLLEDCSREGARLWILMKSHFVGTQFRLLIRTVATALDVLPLNLIDAEREVKELVELVAKQAQKAKFEVDGDDERALNRVRSILSQFEDGILPGRDVMKIVLDHLDIRSWRDCNKEIRFLEEEINLQSSDGDEREVPLLSSLAAFMSYCRAAMFDTFDYRTVNDQTESNSTIDALDCLNPEDFRCPISLEVMIDPVTVSTGQTYDRSSIEKWLKSGNLICPKTGERLTATELVPNMAVRKLIQQYCADHSISMGKSRNHNRNLTTIVSGSPAAAEAIKFLAQFITSSLVFGTSFQKNKAAYEIRLLAKSNVFNRSCLIEAGAIPPLLNLLASPDHSAKENAISAVLKLSKHPQGKRAIVESGGLRPILAVLKRSQTLESRQIAAAILFYLSSIDEFRYLIGATRRAIPALVSLIRDAAPCGKKNAVVAVFGLLLSPENHQRVIDAGAVPILLDLLSTPPSTKRSDLITDSLAVLASLAESFAGAAAIQENSGLSLISRISSSRDSSRAQREYCVSIMLSMCVYRGAEVIGNLAADASIMASLYWISTEGSAHATKRARSLIRLLQKFAETRPSSSLKSSSSSSEVPQDQFVHVQ